MAPDTDNKPEINLSALPDISKENLDFLDSSFFQSDKLPTPQLPSPASIIQQHGDGGARVIIMEDQNLAVKIDHASHLRLEEVQTMWALRRAFPNGKVPVPEVFGWRTYNEQIFVYMSLVSGKTLREIWPLLSDGDKVSIQNELRVIAACLKRLHQDPPRLIASINRGKVQDRFFRLDYEEGPFKTVEAFNDWVFAAATRQTPGPEGILGLDNPGMYRDQLPNDVGIHFAHGDLTLGNIIVSGKAGTYKVEGIIDWEQAGWYPEYWEYCKMLYGVEYDHEWRTLEWPDKIVQPFGDAAFAFAEYSLWRSP